MEGRYEWHGPKGAKDAFFFKHQDEAEQLVFTGFFVSWEGPGGEVQTCMVVTTEPNTVAPAVHTRMPVVLASEAWLDPAPPAPDFHVHLVDRAQGEHLMPPLV